MERYDSGEPHKRGIFFFGVVKTTRLQTVQSKIAEFVKREHSMRQTLSFQIMRTHNGEGPRGRNPPLSFRLKDVSLNGFISVINGERESEVKCEICGTLLLGKDNCEKHLRNVHFKQFKSLFAKECSSETENHVIYKKWEAEQAFIDGLTFFSEEDREKHALKQTEHKKVESHGMPKSGETFKLVREKSSGPNIFEAERSVFTLNQEGSEPKKSCFPTHVWFFSHVCGKYHILHRDQLCGFNHTGLFYCTYVWKKPNVCGKTHTGRCWVFSTHVW